MSRFLKGNIIVKILRFLFEARFLSIKVFLFTGKDIHYAQALRRVLLRFFVSVTKEFEETTP